MVSKRWLVGAGGVVAVAAAGWGLAQLVRDGPSRLVGTFPVPHHEQVRFLVYQDHQFDQATALDYAVTSAGDTVAPRRFLVGTHDWVQPEDLVADSFDSLVYLSYPTRHDVVVVYDLRSRQAFSLMSEENDSTKRAQLVQRLRRHDPSVRWAR